MGGTKPGVRLDSSRAITHAILRLQAKIPHFCQHRTEVGHPRRIPEQQSLRDTIFARPNGCGVMCRNIKNLFNFDPPVTEQEVRDASLQFVRKISGFNKPSKANEAAFTAALEEIAAASNRLLHSLETTAPPKNREEEAAKAKARAAQRFGT